MVSLLTPYSDRVLGVPFACLDLHAGGVLSAFGFGPLTTNRHEGFDWAVSCWYSCDVVRYDGLGLIVCSALVGVGVPTLLSHQTNLV